MEKYEALPSRTSPVRNSLLSTFLTRTCIEPRVSAPRCLVSQRRTSTPPSSRSRPGAGRGAGRRAGRGSFGAPARLPLHSSYPEYSESGGIPNSMIMRSVEGGMTILPPAFASRMCFSGDRMRASETGTMRGAWASSPAARMLISISASAALSRRSAACRRSWRT